MPVAGRNGRDDGDVITSSQPDHTDIRDKKSNESTRLNAKLVVKAKTHDTTPSSQYGRRETSMRWSIESDLSGIKSAESEKGNVEANKATSTVLMFRVFWLSR